MWDNVLKELKSELSETTIATWFDELEALDLQGNVFYLYCPNEFKKNCIESLFLKNIKGKLCADKGYIGQALFENLFLNGIQLITKVKNNMKNSLMSVADKILLRKRALIETVNDELKNIAQIEHSRHRSFNNFIANSLSAIAAYCFFEKKPAIDLCFVKDGQLAMF